MGMMQTNVTILMKYIGCIYLSLFLAAFFMLNCRFTVCVTGGWGEQGPETENDQRSG
jgi:hypothetical protein